MFADVVATIVLVLVALSYRRILTVPNQQDLDSAVASIEAAVQQLGTDITAELAQVSAGQPVSQASLDKLNAIATSLTGFDASLVADDGSGAPASVPPGG